MALWLATAAAGAPLTAVGNDSRSPRASHKHGCVSIQEGVSDYWCRNACALKGHECPKNVCKCGNGAAAKSDDTETDSPATQQQQGAPEAATDAPATQQQQGAPEAATDAPARQQQQGAPEAERYLSFELCGGTTNQRLALLDGLLIAKATGRFAILPNVLLNGTQDARDGYAMPRGAETTGFGEFFDSQATRRNLQPLVSTKTQTKFDKIKQELGTPRKVEAYKKWRRLEEYRALSADAWLQLDCAYAAVDRVDRAEEHETFWALEHALVPSQPISASAETIVELLQARSLEMGGDGDFTALHLRVEPDWVEHCAVWEETRPPEGRNCNTNTEKLRTVFQIERVPRKRPIYIASELAHEELFRRPGVQNLQHEAGGAPLYAVLSKLGLDGLGWADDRSFGRGARKKKFRTAVDRLRRDLKGASRELLGAIDLEVCRKAEQFVGNSVSTFSAWELMRRGHKCGSNCRTHLHSSFYYNGGDVPLVQELFGDGPWGGAIPPRPLKWVFTTSAASRSDYLMMVKVAVDSALNNTNLLPVLVFDGNRHHDLARWMKTRSVPIVYHRPTWLAKLQESYDRAEADGNKSSLTASSPLFNSPEMMAATWMRIDIPRLGFVDEFILYADVDIMFVKDVTVRDFAVGGDLPGSDNDLHYILGTEALRQEVTSCCLEDGSRVGFGNAGVMLMHVQRMIATNDEFVAWIFTDENLFEKEMNFGAYGPQDQGAYNAFYQGRFQVRTDPLFNWKPYWGYNAEASLIHFHGPKPAQYLAYAGRRCNEDLQKPKEVITHLMDECLETWHGTNWGCMDYMTPWVEFAKASTQSAKWNAKLDEMTEAAECVDKLRSESHAQATAPEGRHPTREGVDGDGRRDGQREVSEAQDGRMSDAELSIEVSEAEREAQKADRPTERVAGGETDGCTPGNWSCEEAARQSQAEPSRLAQHMDRSLTPPVPVR